MIDLSRVKHIYLMPGPTDLRRGSIGLISLLPQAGLEAREHELFLFCNRAGTILKVVERDETGTWLYTRTVDRSKFGWPQDFSQAERDKQRPDSLASTRAESDRIQARKGSVLLLNKDTKKLDLIGLF